MIYETPQGFVEDLVDRMIHPGLYYSGVGTAQFLLFADCADHLSSIFEEMRRAIDKSGVAYRVRTTERNFHIIDDVDNTEVSNIHCLHLERSNIASIVRGRRLNDMFVCASKTKMIDKMNADLLSLIVPLLYRGENEIDECSFVNRLTQGDFGMSSTIDTVHTNKQRLDKIRSVLHAADKIIRLDGYDAISKQSALDALREASKEALGSLNAIEQHIKDTGDIDKV